MGGFLIALEGIDGVGKSTQSKNLHKFLDTRGYPVYLFKEPSEGEYGDQLRKLQWEKVRLPPEEEYALFVSDRKDNVKNNIKPALDNGGVVLLDRYYFSTMAYQGSLGLSPAKIREENEAFAPKPDLLLLFDLPVEKALERINTNRKTKTDLFEKESYLKKVKAIFDSLKDPFVIRINCDESEKKVFISIVEILEEKFLDTFEF